MQTGSPVQLWYKYCWFVGLLRPPASEMCLLFAEEDKMVLDACDKWLQQAEALVIEADAKIEGIMHQDTGNLLAEEWVTFVHKYSMQIKDIEQVGLLSTPKYMCQCLRLAGTVICECCCLA